MENNFIEFDGKVYAIDFDKLIEVVMKSSDGLKNKSKTETWGYLPEEDGVSDFRVLEKEISESTTDSLEALSTIRYDLIKNLLNLIVSPVVDENGNLIRLNDSDDMLFGQRLAFNTLVNEGIIIEIS